MIETNEGRKATKLMIEGPGRIALHEEELPDLQEGEFLVSTLYAGVSAGTTMTYFLGTTPFLYGRWDEENRLFHQLAENETTEQYPRLAGYMEVGTVVESRNQKVSVGSKVAMAYGPKDKHIAAKGEYYYTLPDSLDPLLAVWVAQFGPICVNGVLYAANELSREPFATLKGSMTGQRIIVMGAGMVGLLVGMLAKWAGAKEVAIVDMVAERLEKAESLGLKPLMAGPDLALTIKKRWKMDDPLDSGADIAFQCTGSGHMLSEGLRCLREQGTLIDLGFYQEGAAEVHFGREFHLNRLRHICAQIEATPRHQQSVWDRAKLSEETVVFLEEHGPQIREKLITHIVPFSEAQQAYTRLAGRDPGMMQVVLHPDNS